MLEGKLVDQLSLSEGKDIKYRAIMIVEFICII